MRSEDEIRKRLVESDRNLMGIKESTYYDMEMVINFTLQWVLYEDNIEDSLINVNRIMWDRRKALEELKEVQE